MIAPVLCVPLADFAPLQPPEAVHPVALLELHVSIDAPPPVTAPGEAVNVTLGTTLTVAVAGALVPPGPIQEMEYVVGDVMADVLRVPLGPSAPTQPPDAVHAVAFVELHVSEEMPPAATAVGFALKTAVGAKVTFTVTAAAALLPPGPEQVIE